MRPANRTTVVADPSAPTIVITREFDAPAVLLYDVMTRPEHLERWWGLRSLAMVVCDVDLRVGGTFRYVLRDAHGAEYGWRGTYRELAPGKLIVATERFDGFPDAEAVNTVVFEERGGRTTVTTTVLHASIENRDGHVQSGMEPGVSESYARLDELLARLM